MRNEEMTELLGDTSFYNGGRLQKNIEMRP